MAKISQRTIDEIYASMKIEEVVGDFVSLKRQGSGFVGICPFHDDRNPSMHVTPRLGIYKCFVCDAKGNAINFLMDTASPSSTNGPRPIPNENNAPSAKAST